MGQGKPRRGQEKGIAELCSEHYEHYEHFHARFLSFSLVNTAFRCRQEGRRFSLRTNPVGAQLFCDNIHLLTLCFRFSFKDSLCRLCSLSPPTAADESSGSNGSDWTSFLWFPACCCDSRLRLISITTLLSARWPCSTLVWQRKALSEQELEIELAKTAGPREMRAAEVVYVAW